MMIKCQNCGVLFDDNVAVCPVCHTVDKDNFNLLIGKELQSERCANILNSHDTSDSLESAEVCVDIHNKKNSASRGLRVKNLGNINFDNSQQICTDYCANQVIHTYSVDAIKAEELGKGSLRVALGNDSVFKIVAMRKHPALLPVQIYTIVALLAVIIGAIINYFVTPHILWSPIVLIAMVYGLFTILNTVESQTSTSVKIAYQIAAVTLGFYCSSLLFPYQAWYAEYCLPTIMIVGMTMQFMFMLETHNKYRPHYVSTVCVAILGYIPIIVALLQQVYLITSYVSAGVATFIILLTVIAGGRAMWTEMRGRFEY